MNCNELILDNVVGIDIVMAEECQITIPPTIALSSLTPTDSMFPSPVFTARMDGTAEVNMDVLPTVKVSNSRQTAGMVFTHDIQLSLADGRKLAQDTALLLQGREFHLIYICADGSRLLAYALPNTPTFDVELSPSPTTASTVKIKLQSMSGCIALA